MKHASMLQLLTDALDAEGGIEVPTKRIAARAGLLREHIDHSMLATIRQHLYAMMLWGILERPVRHGRELLWTFKDQR